MSKGGSIPSTRSNAFQQRFRRLWQAQAKEFATRRSDRGADSPKFANWFGTTIRMYDPTIQAWRVNWFNPHDGFRAELIGRRRGKDIVQEGKFPDGTPIRWTFSDITENSCRWRGERLEPDGKTWRLQVEFRARRTA